jgi:hypothetical protein
MKITRGTKVLGGNLTQSHFVHHVTWAGFERLCR